MPDITMCKEESCPKKMDCYRYRAIPDFQYQSYFAGSPIKDGECEHFQEIHFRSIYVKDERKKDDKDIWVSDNDEREAKASRKTKSAS